MARLRLSQSCGRWGGWNGSQVIVTSREGNELTAWLVGRNHHGLTAVPRTRKNFNGKSCVEISSKRGFFQRESMKSARHDDHFAIGDIDPQNVLEPARREKIVFAIEDEGRELRQA